MRVCEAIDALKAASRHVTEFGKPVDPNHDKVLFDGGLDDECTGVTVCGFASYDVIAQAKANGSNLIVCHEGMFWNHGDDTSWLSENEVFQAKRRLLEDARITVWRDFEHAIAGIGLGEGYADGIAYGIVRSLGWTDMLDAACVENHCHGFYLTFSPKGAPTARQIAEGAADAAGLNGITLVGDPSTPVSRLYLCRHQFLGYIDAEVIKEMESEGVDAIVCGEMMDYTVASYVRESCMAGRPRAIINLGNFNMAELGMRHVAGWAQDVLGSDLPVGYVSSGDSVAAYL